MLTANVHYVVCDPMGRVLQSTAAPTATETQSRFCHQYAQAWMTAEESGYEVMEMKAVPAPTLH